MPDRRPLPPACLLKDGYGILSGEMEAVSLEDMQIGEWRIAFDKNATRRLYSHLDEPARVTRALVEAGVALEGIEQKGANLEDYFLKLIGGVRHG